MILIFLAGLALGLVVGLWMGAALVKSWLTNALRKPPRTGPTEDAPEWDP